MPDHKEMGREPTEREREVTFAPHQSPKRQGDGDPGAKRPRIDHEQSADETEDTTDDGSVAGDRGQWDGRDAI